MGSRQVGNWLVIVLITLNLLAIFGILNVWWDNGEPASPPQARKALDIPVAPMLRNQQGLNEFRDVAARSLFSPDRTGPEVTGVARQGQGSIEGKLLLGTIIIGSQKVALIGGPPVGRQRETNVEAIKLGDEWEGFKVVDINRGAVVFQNKNGATTLQFPE